MTDCIPTDWIWILYLLISDTFWLFIVVVYFLLRIDILCQNNLNFLVIKVCAFVTWCCFLYYFRTSPSTSLNASLDQLRQRTTLVLKHNLGKCHVYDSFLHSSVPAVSWLGEGSCLFSLLFIISSFRSLCMDL